VCGDSDKGPETGHFGADKAVILGWIPRSFWGGRSGHFEPDSPVILERITHRGAKEVGGTQILYAGRVGRDLKGSAYYRMKRKLGRRASIEPRIWHLKARFRLGRNFLKGVYGGMANVILTASAMNLVNWMGRFLLSIFETLCRSNKMLETLRVLLT
jgi:hypothetical protein